MMEGYPKIYGPYKRHTDGPERNKLIPGAWTSPELEVLQGVSWSFTEKVDGTNIRIGWDGHKPRFAGRTDRAQIPPDLLEHLQATFTEELLEQTFQAQEVTLYGEGFGAGIQKAGGNYSRRKSFALFDVKIDKYWLLRENLEGIAEGLGTPLVPQVLVGTLHDGIKMVSSGLWSDWGEFEAEGVVGVPVGGLLARNGNRIQVKIKSVDFREWS